MSKYPFEKQGNWKPKEIFKDGHILAKFSESERDRTAFVKCLCDCPLKATCKRWTDTMPKHNQILGRPFQTKDNEFFCEFHIALDAKGFHSPYKTTL